MWEAERWHFMNPGKLAELKLHSAAEQRVKITLLQARKHSRFKDFL